MSKRTGDDAGFEDSRDIKRVRPSNVDRLSRLSDELTLRVLSLLPESQLVVCQRYAREQKIPCHS